MQGRRRRTSERERARERGEETDKQTDRETEVEAEREREREKVRRVGGAGPTPKGAREYGGKEEGEWMVHGNANALEETFCAAYEMLDNMWVHEPPANILFFNE
eukprot:2767173-Rhodomonas_salina.1